MADTFRKTMDARCGAGGVKCSCCNKGKKGRKALLRREVRRTQKQALKKGADHA